MYCPHCGVQNIEETKFCRNCGEDLRLVAQAVSKSLPLLIAHRVDEAIDKSRGGWRTYQLFRAEHRKSFFQIMMGLSSLFVIIWVLMLGHASPSFAGGFLLVMIVSMLATNFHEIWNRRQQRFSTDEVELRPSVTTKELQEPQDISGLSVTEPTTKRLKVRSKR